MDNCEINIISPEENNNNNAQILEFDCLFNGINIFDDEKYLEISEQLLKNIFPHLAKYPSSYSNWITLLIEEVFGIYEIAVTGENSENMRKEMENNYIPNKIILGGKKGSLPLLQDKFGAVTQIFICKDKTCGLPASNISEALKQIRNV